MAKLNIRAMYVSDIDPEDEQDCPACDGRGDLECLTCGGLGYV